MNFDGYAQYMIRKYSLAVALAVIKTKPGDIDIEKHINNIKNKIHKSKMDSNDEICEEDFEFNSRDSEVYDIDNESNDSVTILNNIDINNLNRFGEMNMESDSNSFLGVFKTIKDIERNPDIMNTATTFLPGSQHSQTSFLNIVNEDITFCKSENEIEFNDKITESENNDSEQTQLYTLPDMNTHISQSQDNFVISKKYLIAKTDDNKNDKILKSNERQDECRKTEYINTFKETNTPNLTISFDRVQEIENSKSQEIPFETKCMLYNETNAPNKSQENYIALDRDLSKRISQNVSSFNEFEYFSTQTNIEINSKEINNKNIHAINEISNINETECMYSDSNSDDLTESQAEIVTFKVLEELSKVKNYIKREKINTDSDSGYKSSQTRGSYKGLSGTCWNESAQCLLNFLNTCPLVVSVVDITEEISKVLGELIDKLHEEEKYPKFMDVILENVENLINNIYNSGTDDDNSILKIDEKIHRIFLLNRSPHIIKFSIDKITNILENILPELQNTMEITQTERTENLCHIFHILEILLKRNISHKKYSSQASSQDIQETVLKKSSLTEIWRKKWNLSKSEVFEAQGGETQCTMTKCRDVLNKITVEGMECYSLISFTALQCYNILQK